MCHNVHKKFAFKVLKYNPISLFGDTADEEEKDEEIEDEEELIERNV